VTVPPHPSPPGRPCAVASALSLVGEKWALLAVREILFGNRRFDVIVRNTGAPRDRMAARLRGLEEAGIIERRPYNERPPRYEYHLTAAGRELAPVIRALSAWGDRWAVDEPPSTMLHHNHKLDHSWTCRTCGEEIRGRDLSVEVHVPGWDLSGPVG
jgi:DNA-binding HxlR family transcriptional regulator